MRFKIKEMVQDQSRTRYPRIPETTRQSHSHFGHQRSKSPSPGLDTSATAQSTSSCFICTPTTVCQLVWYTDSGIRLAVVLAERGCLESWIWIVCHARSLKSSGRCPDTISIQGTCPRNRSNACEKAHCAACRSKCHVVAHEYMITVCHCAHFVLLLAVLSSQARYDPIDSLSHTSCSTIQTC